jgi:hypothetical protein
MTVHTVGSPTPSLRKVGALPRGLHFVNNHDGTGTIKGTPTRAGVKHFTIKATFGRGRSKHIVTQAFTLTVSG